MKRFFCILLILIISTPALAGEISAISRDEISVFLENTQVEFSVSPVISDGRILAPIREISETLGAVVSWDEMSKTALIDRDDVSVSFVIGEKFMIINGEEKETDVAAAIVGSRTFVPLRVLAEALELEVLWEDETKTAFLSLKKPLKKDYLISPTYYIESAAFEGCVIACKAMALSNHFDKEYTFDEVLLKNGGSVYSNWGEEYCFGVQWRVIMENELPVKEEMGIWEESAFSVTEKLEMIVSSIEDSSGIIAQFAKDNKTHGIVITGYTAEGELIVCDPDTNSEEPANTLIGDSCLAKMFELYTTEELLPYLISMRMIAN